MVSANFAESYMNNSSLSRRHFFYGSLLAGALPAAGYASSPSLKHLRYKSPNEKLNIASVGAGGRASEDIRACSHENIVALSDPDDARAEKTFKLYPDVPKYKDFRRMFDAHAKDIDAVIVACPDHVHASAAMPNFIITEYFLPFEELCRRLCPNALRPVDGYIALPDGPGLGLNVDEGAVRAEKGRQFPARIFRSPADEGP